VKIKKDACEFSLFCGDRQEGVEEGRREKDVHKSFEAQLAFCSQEEVNQREHGRRQDSAAETIGEKLSRGNAPFISVAMVEI
jgi:hypothetical protein